MALLPPASVFPHVMTEDAMLDFYQNVLFSIAHFHELTGAYPSCITIIGHTFKCRHFKQLHRLTLRWPKTHFMYEGLPLQNERQMSVRLPQARYCSLLSFQHPFLHV
jgi:hypothetical protein